MKRGVVLLGAVGIAVVLSALAPSRANAGCFGCAVGAGIFGGLVAGAVIGSAVAAAPPPRAYYGPPGPGCYYARRPVWDPYAGAYVRGPRVLVCP